MQTQANTNVLTRFVTSFFGATGADAEALASTVAERKAQQFNRVRRVLTALAKTQGDGELSQIDLENCGFGCGLHRDNLEYLGFGSVPAELRGEYLGETWLRGNAEDIALDVYATFVVSQLRGEGRRKPLSASAVSRHIATRWGVSQAMMQAVSPESVPSIDFAVEVLGRLEDAGIIRRRPGLLTSFELTGEQF